MDIIITKDHMQGGAWVFAGTELGDVDPTRAADLIRNGLARPATFIRLRQAVAAPAESAPSVKAAANKDKKKVVQTSAQPPAAPSTAASPPPQETAEKAPADGAADAGGQANDVQTSALSDTGTDAGGGDSGNGAD